MAKQDIDNNYDLDDIDFEDFGDDAFGDFNSMNKPKTTREAAIGLAGNFVSGMGEELLNPTTQRRIIQKAMPPGFAQGHDALYATINSADEIMSEVNKGMGDLVNTTKTAVNSILPKLVSVLPEKILKGIQDWSKPSESYNYDNGNSDDDTISTHLADLGKSLETIQKQQLERDNNARLKSDAINIANNAVTGKLLEQQNEHLVSIRKLMNRQVAGQEQVAFKFHQKSLEVQYRTYFATRKLSDTAEKTLALQETAFRDLLHNTSLPDIVKMKNNEIATQLLKERAFEAVMNSSKDTFTRVGRRIVQQAKPKIQNFFKDANSVIGDLNGLFDLASSVDDTGSDPKELVASLLGNLAMSQGSDFIGKELAKRYGDNENLKRHGLAILNLLNNQEGYLADAMDVGIGGNRITDFIRDNLGGDAFFTHNGARTIKASRSNAELEEATALRWRTVNTIEDIIPGWLQMLHNEVQMIRTGDHTLRPHFWNTSKGVFETEAKTKQRLKTLVRDNIGTEADAAGELLNTIDSENKLSKSTREKLMSYIVKNRRNKHKRLNLKDIAAGNTDVGLTMAELDEVYDLVNGMEGGGWMADRSTIEARIKDDFSSSLEYQEHKQRIDTAHEKLLNTYRDQDDDIRNAVQNGQTDLLVELGLINVNEDGSITTDEDRRVDRISKHATKYLARGGSTGPGDRFERKGIVHANEYVVRSEAAMQPGAKSFLDAFNHKGMAALQGYDTGGMVGRVKNYTVKDESTRGLGDALIDAIRDNNPNEALRDVNEKLTGILQLSAELVQNGITSYQFGQLGSRGILETGLAKGLGLAKWLGNKTIEWNKWLLPKSMTALKAGGRASKDLVFGNFNKIKLGGVGVDEAIIDVFVRGSNTPVITKRGLLNGEYIDAATGTVIRTLKDITGDVRNLAGETVLTLSDIQDGLYMGDGRDVRKVWSGLFNKVKGLTSWSIGGVVNSWKAQLNVMGRIKDRLSNAWNRMSDVYVKGEDSPRLLARLLNNGKYLQKRNGNVVRSLNDIDGEIVDLDGNTVLTMEDIQRGLVDKDGEEITTRASRMLRGIKKFTNGAGKFISGSYDFAKSAIRTGWDASTGVLGGIRDLFFGGGITTIGNKNKNVLFDIRDILDDRLPGKAEAIFGDLDGDGDRDNGVRDIMERRRLKKEAKEKDSKDESTPEKEKKGWGLMSILTGLGGMLSGIYTTVKGGISTTIDWLKRIALAKTLSNTAGTAADILDGGGNDNRRNRRGGRLSRMGNFISRGPGWAKLAGAGMLAGGAYYGLKDNNSSDSSEMTRDPTGRQMMVDDDRGFMQGMAGGLGLHTADDVAKFGLNTAATTGILAASAGALGGALGGGTLASAGLGALAALGGPVTLGIIATGAATYAGVKLYQKLTNINGDLTEFRMTQYGFDGKDTERAGKILQLEKIMLAQVSVGTNGEVKIKNGVKAKEVVELFELSSEKEILSLNHWLVYRFRPIFDLWVKSYATLSTRGKFNEADTRLDRNGKLALLKLVHGPSNRAYAINSSPFVAPPTAAFVGSDVDGVYRTVIDAVSKGPTGRTANVSQRISEKAADVWGDVKSGATTVWRNVKDFGGKVAGNISAGAATAYEVGKSGLKSVGSAISSGASAVASAAGSAWDFLSGAAKGGYNAVKSGLGSIAHNVSEVFAETPGIFQGTGGSIGNIPKATGKGWSNVKDTILSAANMVGVDPALMVGVAAVESGFNPSAKASTSSASGLYQFINSTWKAMISKHGKTYGIPPQTSPLDARANAVLGAAYIKENAQVVKNIKGKVSPTDVYMAHFLGAGGVRTFLNAMRSNPNQAAASVLPSAAKANKSIFYDGNRARSLAEVYQMMQNKLMTRARDFGVDLNNLKASVPASPNALSNADGADKGTDKKPGKLGTNVPKTSSGIPLSIAKPGATAGSATSVPALQSQADQIMKSASTNVATGNHTGQTATATAPDKLKRLLATATDELVNLGKKVCVVKSGVNVARMNGDFMRLFYAMIGEWVQKGYGSSVQINSGWRDTEKQRILYENYVRTKKPPMAAAPGKSKHEFGVALDINSVNANSLASSGLLSRWGFFRPLLNHKSFPEPWHIEHAYFTKGSGSTAKAVVQASSNAAPAPKRVERNIKGGSVVGVIDPTDGQIKPIGDIVSGNTNAEVTNNADADSAKATVSSDKAIATATITSADVSPSGTGTTTGKTHVFNESNPQLSPQQLEADRKKLAETTSKATKVDTVQLPETMSPKQRKEAAEAMASNAQTNKYFERSIAIQSSIDNTLKSVLTELRGVNQGQQGMAKGLMAQAEAALAHKQTPSAPANTTPNNTRDPISLRS